MLQKHFIPLWGQQLIALVALIASFGNISYPSGDSNAMVIGKIRSVILRNISYPYGDSNLM